MSRVRNELLTDVAKQVEIILAEFNLDPEQAEQAGLAVSNHLAEHWGGQYVTIPKDFLFKTSRRDLALFQELNRDNINELSKKYNISVNGIYRAVKRIRKQAIAEKQPDMFWNSQKERATND